MGRHLPDPRWVNLIIDGNRVTLSAKAAETLRSSETDGTLRCSLSLDMDRMFRHAGWALQSRGRSRLTAAGLRVRAALWAYDERKKQALAELTATTDEQET
jgi:hypothetical protein